MGRGVIQRGHFFFIDGIFAPAAPIAVASPAACVRMRFPMPENTRALKTPIGPRPPSSVYSEANIITIVRLLASLAFFVLAMVRQRELYNFIGLAIHLGGDFLDGWFSRTFKQESILGAELDIIADRVEVLFFFVNFVHFHPRLWLPVLVYVLDFAFVDFYLSYQFVKFDIISINYFYKVDRLVYRLNYSPLGKAVNSLSVLLILIFAPKLWGAALAITVALIGVKIYSCRRLLAKIPVRPDR